MFTVTKAIPFLYEYQLEFYVHEKPCFGVNEVYLETSKIHNIDMTKGNHKNIHALDVENTGLVKKKKRNFLQKFIFQQKKR